MKSTFPANLLRWFLAASVSLGVLPFTVAAPLPNAWQITDNSVTSGSVLYYTNVLSTAHTTAATNHGFRFTVQARFVDDFNGPKTMNMIYGLGTRRLQLWWYLDGNNNLIAEFEAGPAFLVTTNGTGTNLFHTHEIVFNPTNQTASYLLDGELKVSGLASIPIAWPAGTVHWGAGSSAGKAQVNFHRVSFEITNTVVALYDAGVAPTTAPDPTNSGWVRHQAVPLANTGVTNVSPDAVSEPTAPTAATLNASSPNPHQAMVTGTVVPGGLSVSTWFEWGTSTNYDNATPIRRWLSGVTNAALTETLTGLSQGFGYYVRSVASNSLGVAYGEDVEFSTPSSWIITSRADSGPGSLRYAINNSVSGDAITFHVGGTITLGGAGPLFITNDLTIIGHGAANLAISGNDVTGVFSIGSGKTVRMSGLTVTNGISFMGGGIHNLGTLLMSHCTITANATYGGNVSGTGGVGGNGGGIYNGGTLTLLSCFVSLNNAGDGRNGVDGDNGVFGDPDGLPGTDGKAGGDGGGIYNVGSLTAISSTFYGNNAGDGGDGGDGGDAFVLGSGGNAGDAGRGGFGGGIYNGTSSATLFLSNCTFYANGSGSGGWGGEGGSPGVGTAGSGGTGGQGGDGGSIYNVNFATLTLTACTITENSRGFGGRDGADGAGNPGQDARDGLGAGIFTLSTVPAALRNTVVAQNHSGTINQLWGTNFLSHGHNLVGYNGGFVLLNQTTTDIVPPPGGHTNALFDIRPPGDYGGPTRTLPLQRASPAVDAGDDTLATALVTDQRGAARRSGAHVDIGAFELQHAVMNTNDSGLGSLRDTVFFCLPLETISFDPGLSGQTIRLTSGQLTISKSLTFDASALVGGIVIDAGGNFRVLEIAAGASAVLDSFFIKNGNAFSGGGILANGNLTIRRSTLSGNSATYGGGISGYGALNLFDSIITGNSASQNTGGIENNGGVLTIVGCFVSSNSANYGGGFGNWSGGEIRITNSTFSGNSATQRGGGGYNVGSVITIHGSTFSDNSARSGGAVYSVQNAIAGLNNSTLSGNRTTERGAGIVNNASTLTINNSTLAGNQAGTEGGGIVNDAGTLLMTNTIVAGNSASTAPNILGVLSGANNLTNGVPQLKALGDYGGPTRTMPPLFGSPAIDAGRDSVTNFLATDQHGYRRHSGTNVDIGAVEVQQASSSNPPQITQHAVLPGGALRIAFTNDPAIDFSVYASTNVAALANQWTRLGPASQLSPGQYQYIDSSATNYPQRFYKVFWP